VVSFAPRDPLTEQVIGLAIAVHRDLGPGVLESACEECLCYELKEHGIDLPGRFLLPLITKESASIAATGSTLSLLANYCWK
jgi:GxxExxY protein